VKSGHRALSHRFHDDRHKRAWENHHQYEMHADEPGDANHRGEVDAAGDGIAAEQVGEPQLSCIGFQTDRPVATARQMTTMTLA
jgi:hypothetical protein